MVVHLIFVQLLMVKAGRCSENCKYCAQSVYYQTGIDIYNLLKISEIKAIAYIIKSKVSNVFLL